MSKLSLLDKLGILIDLSMSSKEYLIALAILLVFGIVLSFTNKRNEGRNKVLYFMMTVVIIAILIASYHSSLGKMMSYMMNNFFIAVYFPNIAIYLAAIVAMNVIVWISIFSFKSSKQIRLLNVSIYIIMNYIMALLLKVINTNKLDIFDQTSLYGDKNAMALIELSSIIFIVWIIFLVLYKLILIYIRKEYKPRVKRIIVRKKVKKLPENFEPKTIPEMVYGKAPTRETLVIETKEITGAKEIIDTSEKSEDEILLEHFSKQFTLEDYKLFSKLLHEQQEREKQASESIEEDYRKNQKEEIIRMEEERRELLRQEQEKQQREEEERQERIEQQKKEEQELEFLLQQTLAEEEREQRKLTELETLYR